MGLKPGEQPRPMDISRDTRAVGGRMQQGVTPEQGVPTPEVFKSVEDVEIALESLRGDLKEWLIAHNLPEDVMYIDPDSGRIEINTEGRLEMIDDKPVPDDVLRRAQDELENVMIEIGTRASTLIGWKKQLSY